MFYKLILQFEAPCWPMEKPIILKFDFMAFDKFTIHCRHLGLDDKFFKLHHRLAPTNMCSKLQHHLQIFNAMSYYFF